MNHDTKISISIGLSILAFAVISISVLFYYNDQNGIKLEKDWNVIKSNIDLKSCKELNKALLVDAQQPYINIKDNKFYDETYRYVMAKIIAGDCTN